MLPSSFSAIVIFSWWHVKWSRILEIPPRIETEVRSKFQISFHILLLLIFVIHIPFVIQRYNQGYKFISSTFSLIYHHHSSPQKGVNKSVCSDVGILSVCIYNHKISSAWSNRSNYLLSRLTCFWYTNHRKSPDLKNSTYTK